MIIEGIDLSSNNRILAQVNPLKKTVSIVGKGKPARKIYGFPVVKTLFRFYDFPFKNREKLQKALLSHLKYDLPVSLDELEYSYITRQDSGITKVFCVIVRKEELKDFENNASVDSEIFAVIRLMKSRGIASGTVIHFAPKYTYVLKVKDGFPDFVRTVREEELGLYLDKGVVLSGFIPEKYRNQGFKLLENPTGKTEMNVAYGLVLKGLDNTGVDLLHKDKTGTLISLLKGVLFLFLGFVVLNIGLMVAMYLKEGELAYVKEKQKELFIKYFGTGTPVYEPLTQAKGIVQSIKGRQSVKEDAIDLLNYIGKAKKDAGITEIYKVSISAGMFSVYGKADTITQVEKFKDILSKKYEATVEETVNTPSGKIRFVVKGKVK